MLHLPSTMLALALRFIASQEVPSQEVITLGDVRVEVVYPHRTFSPGDPIEVNLFYDNQGSQEFWISEAEDCPCGGQRSHGQLQPLSAGMRVTRPMRMIADPRLSQRAIGILLRNPSGEILTGSISMNLEIANSFKLSYSALRSDSGSNALILDLDAHNVPMDEIDVPVYSDLISKSEVLEKAEGALSMAFYVSHDCMVLLEEHIRTLSSWIIPLRNGVPVSLPSPPTKARELLLALPGTGVTRWSLDVALACTDCKPESVGYLSNERLDTSWRSEAPGSLKVILRKSSPISRAIPTMVIMVVKCTNVEHHGKIIEADLLPSAGGTF